MSGKTNGWVSSVMSASPGAARGLSLGLSKHLQIELFIEFGDFALRRRHEQLGRHADEDAVVASGVITQRVPELLGHQTGIAGGGQQTLEASQELFSSGDSDGEARADPRT